MAKVLVIGATGYLGLAIGQALRRSSVTVYGFTRSKDKADLLALNEIIPVIGNVEDSASYLSIIASEKIDTVIDASTAREASHGVLHNLHKVEKAKLQEHDGNISPKMGYVYISGMWLHGDSQKPTNDLEAVGLPQSTAQPPKLVAWRPHLEREVLRARDLLNVAIVRPALLYGRHQSRFATYFEPMQKAAKEGAPKLGLPASKETMLALVHVDDCAEGVSAIVEQLSLLSTDGVHPVFDLMSSYESMYVVLEQAAKLLGFKGELEYEGPGENLLAQALCCTVRGESTRARSLLGWVPKKKGLLEELEIHVKAYVATEAVMAPKEIVPPQVVMAS